MTPNDKEHEHIRMMKMALNQFAAELVARAARLDHLAAQMEARELDMEMRENDVIKAWEEVKAQKVKVRAA